MRRASPSSTAFDPELVVVFGGNHYQGIHLNLAPTFVVGQIAEGVDDCGGTPGKLDVPMETSIGLADHLIHHDFDIATSYAMVVDHGFTNVLGNFFGGKLDTRPVLPVHINTLTFPRPTFRRCRLFGEAVGAYAKTLGKRVAFLGSGGLSHQTESIFPQYEGAPNEEMRDYMVHGQAKSGLNQEVFNQNIIAGMTGLSASLIDGSFTAPWINADWDRAFLDTFAKGDLSEFDGWTDADVIEKAGYGGGEVRAWVAAAAAGQIAGAAKPVIDYYSDSDKLAIGVGVAHALAA